MYEIRTNDRIIKSGSPRAVYYDLVEIIFNKDSKNVTEEIHTICADAEGWCELACVGDIYEHDEFVIEVID